MKNQPGNMKNQPGTMKNHENRPGTMNNQPGTMNTHENRPGTINKQKRYKQTDTQNLPIIYRFGEYFFGDIKGKDEDLEKKCRAAMRVIIPGICGKCFLRLSATTLS